MLNLFWEVVTWDSQIFDLRQAAFCVLSHRHHHDSPWLVSPLWKVRIKWSNTCFWCKRSQFCPSSTALSSLSILQCNITTTQTCRYTKMNLSGNSQPLSTLVGKTPWTHMYKLGPVSCTSYRVCSHFQLGSSLVIALCVLQGTRLPTTVGVTIHDHPPLQDSKESWLTLGHMVFCPKQAVYIVRPFRHLQTFTIQHFGDLRGKMYSTFVLKKFGSPAWLLLNIPMTSTLCFWPRHNKRS